METIDSFFYESEASQSLYNMSRALSNYWANTSLSVLYGKKANELQTYANKSWEYSGSFNESDYIINMANDSNASFPLIRPTNIIDVTTIFNSNVIDDLPWWDIQSWNRTPYPSGYSQLSIVVLAFFITCIMILIVVGNMLVCIAIATEKSLKPVQNWFIASLAVSDFLLGLVIMPFSLARELMGYWMFGQIWCDIHAALDVLLCTASINNLFMISLDRYWSITQAVKYLKKRTPSRAALMIAFVWILSALVSLPPLVGWKKPEKSNDYPQCDLSDDIGYVLYSAIGSFYFPALMMVFVYARIFVAARTRARRHIQHKRLNVPPEVTNDPAKEKSTTTTTCTSLSNPSPPDQTDQNKDEIEGGDDGVVGCKPHTPESSPVLPSLQLGTNQQIMTASSDLRISSLVERNAAMASPTSLSPPQIVIEAIAESHYSSPTKEIAIISNNYDSNDSLDVNNDESDVQIKCSQHSPIHKKRSQPKLTIVLPETNVPAKVSIGALPKQNGSATRTTETRFISNDEDSDAIESPLSKETLTHESKSFLSAPKLLKSSYGSTLSIADYDDSDLCIENDNNSDDNHKKYKKNSHKGRVQYHNPPVVGIHTPSDAERHKRKIAKARERRATLILGLIMAAFITAWMPFFVLYVLTALCVECKESIPSGVFALAFWLGYCNSAANPIIYTIFNRDFRRAFRKILFK